jgi:hypothetical protein
MYIFRLSDDYLSFDDATSESIQTTAHNCAAAAPVPRQARSPCTCALSSPLADVNVLNSLTVP